MLHYGPDVFSREPLAGEVVRPRPDAVARTAHRFDLDLRPTARPHRRDRRATGRRNWPPPRPRSSSAGAGRRARPDALPREVVLELNTIRLSRPIFWPRPALRNRRTDMRPAWPADSGRRIGGPGRQSPDAGRRRRPAPAPDMFRVIDAATAAGVAVHLETDLLGPDVEIGPPARRVRDPISCSIHLPALTDKHARGHGHGRLPAGAGACARVRR